jgi:hypothetical protein
MPRPYTGNLPLHARLTPTDIAILEREKARRDLPSLSAVLDEALRQLIEATDAGRKGLLIVPTQETIIKRSYLISPAVHESLETMTRNLGFNLQQILRAAIAALDRDQRTPGSNRPLNSGSWK